MFNKEKFSEKLIEIIKNYSSITDFSDKSGAERSYISKYIHKKIDSPPSPNVLKRIAEYSNGTIDYYELLDICGYISLHNILDTEAFRKVSNDPNVQKFLNKYVDEYLKKSNERKSNIITPNVFPTTDDVITLPVLGKISAGLPILAVENIEDYMPAPSSLLKHDHEYFYLRVQGDSMNKKFPEGSLLLIQKQNVLEPNEIGVFRINGNDATVKQFKTEENGIITLSPMSYNPIHKEQKYNLKDVPVEIIGKVISFMGIL